MDYVFFAFSALCLGFAVLLAILPAFRDRQLLLRQLLAALAIALAYYILEISVFSKSQTLYYLGNLLPQLLLLVSLAVYLWRHDRSK